MKFKSGKRADLGGVFFRSKWEANWARYLEWMKSRGEIQSWEFESETFEFEGIKRGGRFYTPDFKVILRSGETEFQEVKGYMDKRSATKIRRMAKYYPNVRLILIDSKQYNAMAREMRRILPSWE